MDVFIGLLYVWDQRGVRKYINIIQYTVHTFLILKRDSSVSGFMSCSITSRKVIDDLRFLLSGSTPCRVMEEFVRLSVYAICAYMILAHMPYALR